MALTALIVTVLLMGPGACQWPPPPSGQIVLANHDSLISSTSVSVQFRELSKPVTRMRLAGSVEALEAADWRPFEVETTFELEPANGWHTVYAQLRDASGETSRSMLGTVELDLVAPTSRIEPVPEFTTEEWIWLPFTASDNRALASVQLLVRYRPADSDPWEDWSVGYAATSTSPVLYRFVRAGEYELATTASDMAGNRELLPPVGDVAVSYQPE